MKKRDKTQGVVYVLPKSREFFGRIAEDFEKVKLPVGSTPLLSGSAGQAGPAEPDELESENEGEIAALEELKEHLSKLVKLQEKLKGLLNDLDHLVKEE